MKIGVLIKQVPDTETKIRIKPDSNGIEESDTKYIVNPYDEFAIEEAIQTKAKVPGAETFVISLGPDRVVEAIRTALAMGIDKAVHIQTTKPLDSFQTAKALAKVIQDKQIDLVFCGKMAIDGYNGQVTSMVAEFLSAPQVMIVEKFELGGDQKSAKVTRNAGSGIKEIYNVAFPAVIGCDKGMNTPRYASLPGIMKAKTKPVEKLSAADLLGGETAKVRFANYSLPPERAAGKKLTGEPAEQAAQLVRFLREEAKVI